MKKTREPLDRSDVISIISLCVAGFGTLISAVFTLLAYETAMEANRIAVGANSLAQESNRIAVAANELALESNSPNVQVELPLHVSNIEFRACREQAVPGQFELLARIQTYGEGVVSNVGGRAVSLLSMSILVLKNKGEETLPYHGDLSGRVALVEGNWTTEEKEGIEPPIELAPGTSRKGNLHSVITITRGASLGEEEARKALEVWIRDQYVLRWTFRFNNGKEVQIEQAGFDEGGWEPQGPRECNELMQVWGEPT